ncbi:DnaD and phage-associated domain-containing protein [Butyrivibrio sp. INlla18]|uniref:DnaD domain protein n=1 Tax=Butyrivibrio sp. INlla18 TaxID=1520806 RepID=UPI0008810B93|nr:DnaD domain protein [Butyrivibrio sp. INlla18]SDA44192.1 DnaD and phage-associated domain-containing protein [Butyrivibrio sp. INlla18]
MMGRVTISHNLGEDSTNVSNIFIDEYMQDANDAQIKIYLFLLRMMSANLPTSVSALADKFNHTEKDVIRALKYWEKKELISLEYDVSGNLTGIHMEDIVAPQNLGRRKSDTVLRTVSSHRESSFEDHKEELPEVVAPSKPKYSAAQLRAFKQTEGANIAFLAEQYFGRPLASTEMLTLYYIHDELKFSDDLLDYLMQYCVDNHKTDFRYVEKVALSWSQEGIKTPKQARAEIYKHDPEVISIMKALGMDNSPTEKEGNFISSWRGELGFSMDIIAEACDRTVMATQKNRLKYCDSILRSWHEKKVETREDIARLDADFTADLKKKRSMASVSSINSKLRSDESYIRQSGNQNRFNQFQQNTYNFAELEEKLLDN